mgnify:CR=1 FL=1
MSDTPLDSSTTETQPAAEHQAATLPIHHWISLAIQKLDELERRYTRSASFALSTSLPTTHILAKRRRSQQKFKVKHFMNSEHYDYCRTDHVVAIPAQRDYIPACIRYLKLCLNKVEQLMLERERTRFDDREDNTGESGGEDGRQERERNKEKNKEQGSMLNPEPASQAVCEPAPHSSKPPFDTTQSGATQPSKALNETPQEHDLTPIRFTAEYCFVLAKRIWIFLSLTTLLEPIVFELCSSTIGRYLIDYSPLNTITLYLILSLAICSTLAAPTMRYIFVLFKTYQFDNQEQLHRRVFQMFLGFTSLLIAIELSSHLVTGSNLLAIVFPILIFIAAAISLYRGSLALYRRQHELRADKMLWLQVANLQMLLTISLPWFISRLVPSIALLLAVTNEISAISFYACVLTCGALVLLTDPEERYFVRPCQSCAHPCSSALILLKQCQYCRKDSFTSSKIADPSAEQTAQNDQ